MTQTSANGDKHRGDVPGIVAEQKPELFSMLFWFDRLRFYARSITHPPSDTVTEINQAAFEAATSSMLWTSSTSLSITPNSASMCSV
jgi:hypothetical protein